MGKLTGWGTKRLSVVASHLCAVPASSVAVAVDVDAIVEAPGDEAPRLIALAQLAKLPAP